MSESSEYDTQITTDNKNVYEKRIVAYADILGWSKTTEDATKFNRLFKTVNAIKKHAGSFSQETKEMLKKTFGISDRAVKEHSSIEFSYFSDCFAISAPVDHGPSVFKILSFASDTLLNERFLVRGGVTLGDLYHRQGIIFGPALIEAVDIEQKEALYPRILCSSKLLELLNETSYRDDVLLQDCCQEWVVNIACGSLINRDDLMKLIEKELHESDQIMRKWRYLQTMLPRMYDLKFKKG